MDYTILFIVLAFIYFIAFQPKEKFVNEAIENAKKTQDYAINMFRSTFKV
jgi:hypothetical protein